ncbi:MAG: hypothetical protein FWB78_02265 [Treponema sp.]|nr:hypothetical protein [Treponema sp.]
MVCTVTSGAECNFNTPITANRSRVLESVKVGGGKRESLWFYTPVYWEPFPQWASMSSRKALFIRVW